MPPPIELARDLDRPGAWVLLVDGVTQSHVDLDDPRHLELEYMRRLGHLADVAAPPGLPLRVLHLGGGGLTLARYVAATRPGSRQLAVEASAEIAALVRRRLPVNRPGRRSRTPGQPSRSAERSRSVAAGEQLRATPRTPGEPPHLAGRIRVRVADARTVVEHLAPGSWDVAVADVFAGAQTPAHLTSVEFTAAAAKVLAPAGLYAVNVGDGPPLAHARARVATVQAVFRHTYLIAEAAVLRGRRFGNLVIAGSGQELPVAELTRRVAADPFPARLVTGGALVRFAAGAKPITDAAATPSPPMPPEIF
jgi:spermidine synthase